MIERADKMKSEAPPLRRRNGDHYNIPRTPGHGSINGEEESASILSRVVVQQKDAALLLATETIENSTATVTDRISRTRNNESQSSQEHNLSNMNINGDKNKSQSDLFETEHRNQAILEPISEPLDDLKSELDLEPNEVVSTDQVFPDRNISKEFVFVEKTGMENKTASSLAIATDKTVSGQSGEKINIWANDTDEAEETNESPDRQEGSAENTNKPSNKLSVDANGTATKKSIRKQPNHHSALHQSPADNVNETKDYSGTKTKKELPIHKYLKQEEISEKRLGDVNEEIGPKNTLEAGNQTNSSESKNEGADDSMKSAERVVDRKIALAGNLDQKVIEIELDREAETKAALATDVVALSLAIVAFVCASVFIGFITVQ